MLGAARPQPGRTVPALAAVLASRAEPDCAHTGRTPRASNRSGQPTIGTRGTTTERQPHRLTATRQVERESLRSYWPSSTCFSPYNVVRIQLRGAAGLGRAQTTVIPRGESCRDIDGFSRVSCNAELGGRAVESAMPGATCWRAGPRKPANAAERKPRQLWRSLPEARSEPYPQLR